MLKQVVLLRFLDNTSSPSSSRQKEGEEVKWQQITGGQSARRGHEYFCYDIEPSQNCSSGHNIRLGLTEGKWLNGSEAFAQGMSPLRVI